MKGLIGKKVGMTQLIADNGAVTPVTLIEAGPCFVTQIRTVDNAGYDSVQLGFEEVNPKRLAAGERGHLKTNNLPPLRHLREFRGANADLKAGDRLAADVFAVGDHVDVVGISKGKGFAAASNATISSASRRLTAPPTGPARRVPAARQRRRGASTKARTWPGTWAV